MRITNNMISNNILLSLSRSKYALSIYEGQLATGKKIQKPSDDPIVAVRALKFRTNIREVQQYKSNAEDAISWMTVTENSVSNIIEIVKKARTLCVQATNDTLGVGERESIITSLKQLKDQLANEGNVDYAGRYVFTGYKTDQPLTFTKAVTDKSYTITEEFTKDDIESIEKIIDEDPPASPRIVNVDRIRLGYSNIENSNPKIDKIGTLNVNTINSNDKSAYEPQSGTVNFLQDTGELIFNSEDKAAGKIPDPLEFKYIKDEFNKNDLNPIHYFNCTDNDTNVVYDNDRDNIHYQVSYNQSVAINSLGSDLITKDLFRDLEEMINEVGKIPDSDSKYYDLLKDSLGDRFNELIGKIDGHKDGLLKQEADLGTRINRLDLTINRLDNDNMNFTDLMSKNEDINIAEVIVNYKSQEMVYNAALMSSTKIIQSTLLDFIR